MNNLEIKWSLSTYLFPMPSFLNGFANIVDIGATFDSYNFSDSPIIADYKAAISDWIMVGNDIEKSVGLYEKSLTSKQWNIYEWYLQKEFRE